MESNLDIALSLQAFKRAENFGGVQLVRLVLLTKHLAVVKVEQWHVDQKCEPGTKRKQQHRGKSVQRNLRHDERVDFSAQINRVDVVSLEITVHDCVVHLNAKRGKVEDGSEDK